jgi:hypothetical protein
MQAIPGRTVRCTVVFSDGQPVDLLVTVTSVDTENAAAGREALRAGSAAAKVAAEFGVTVRTAERWAQRGRAEDAQMVRAGR